MDYLIPQAGVIPYRKQNGLLQILLISNNKHTRWIIPKGFVEPDLTVRESARQEAWEEAGIEGHVAPKPLGVYEYRKWGGLCRVEVFLMRVLVAHDTWLEDHRARQWVPIDEAIELVREAGLKRLLEDADYQLVGHKAIKI